MPDIFNSEDNNKKHIESKEVIEHHHRRTSEPVVEAKVEPHKREDAAPRERFEHPVDTLGNPMFPLASFAVDPSGVSFAMQGEKEQIHLFLRRHFITNAPWIVFSIFLFVLPVFVFPLLDTVPFASSLSTGATWILTIFYYIIVFGTIVLTSFMNWYFNVYIVTNERVIDVDFINILYREISATRLNLIQDVTSKTGGVIKAIFNYGDVFIQTAGAEVNFDFHAVPHPQEVSREIEKLMGKARKQEGKSDFEEQLEK